MAIPEHQLDTWSHQGSKVQSAATYEVIRNALKDPRAPLAGRDFTVFLQGSYGNDTNIYGDSDVDVVCCLNDVFYSDTGALTATELAAYNSGFGTATYSYAQFKAEVLIWLKQVFGAGVTSGNKAIYVPASGNRRESDVLVCAEHRRYTSFPSASMARFSRGIVFWTGKGEMVVNFPRQHSENMTAKHQATAQWLKPNVRIIKNMRNRMGSTGYLADGLAPSYFLEGMLWNVPAERFHTSYQSCFIQALAWLDACESDKLSCANDLHWLLREGPSVCWRKAHFDTFRAAARRFWNDW